MPWSDREMVVYRWSGSGTLTRDNLPGKLPGERLAMADSLFRFHIVDQTVGFRVLSI